MNNENTAAIEQQNPLDAQMYESVYIKPATRLGGATMYIGTLLVMLPAVVLYVLYKEIPTASEMSAIITMVLSTNLAYWFVDLIAYYPTLGTVASYMAFTVGSLNSTRLPCAIAAQEATDATPGTQRGEIMATLGVAGSVVTNTLCVTLGVLFGNLLLSSLPFDINAVAKYVPIAILSTVFFSILKKQKVVGIGGILCALFLTRIGVLVIPGFLLIVCNVAICMAFGVFLHKKSKKDSQ